MKTFSLEGPSIQRELRIDSVLRFGNYFVLAGWQSLSGGTDCDFEMSIGEHHAKPEFKFLYSGADVVSHGPGRQRGFIDEMRFCLCVWINDGYKIEVSDAEPVAVRVTSVSAGTTAQNTTTKIDESNYALLNSICEACATPVVWTNRFILEVLAKTTNENKFSFLYSAIQFISVEEAISLINTLFLPCERRITTNFFPDLLETAVSRSDVRYLDPRFRQAFIDSVPDLKVDLTSDKRLADILRALVKVEAFSTAYTLLGRAIRHANGDRLQLARFLPPVLPNGTQWWLRYSLENEENGADQHADALNTVGSALRVDHRHELACLLFDAAISVHPTNQSAALNAGWTCLESGKPLEAIRYFGQVGRHYPTSTLATLWPMVGNALWPAQPVPTGLFDSLNPAKDWPRISIVTPSYMQGHFIEETILSVINQGYPNLQYIVVDGASTDSTCDVLDKYKDRIDVLIIEPDDGQTEAINKGLRKADGELIAWLNSDDMYAPGALHMTALAYMRTKCDVISGICLEHSEKRFMLVNKPSATGGDFNLDRLADIFNYWLKGHYFYQPEVFFTKAILDKVGLLDESLYYSMDYDLWMRFARASATLEVISWPVGFFRKHDGQKTRSLTECIEEQATVRSKYHMPALSTDRLLEIERGLLSFTGKARPKVAVISKRLRKIFSESMDLELDEFASSRADVVFAENERNPEIADADLVIYLVHVQNDIESIKAMRKYRNDRVVAGWFWDNHHHLFENYAIGEHLDVIIPGHQVASDYLRNRKAVAAPALPLCVTQWSRQDAARWFEQYGDQPRNEQLYGGFVDYAFAPRRSGFLRQLQELLPGHALSLLSERNLKVYFGRSEVERFAEWCRAKTSLVLPLWNDLSQRMFDALLCGQVPLVPVEIADLDHVISPALQKELPILRFTMRDPNSAVVAWEEAIGRFNEGGSDAAGVRHRFALENHMFSSRIATIIDRMFDLQGKLASSPSADRST